MFGEHILLTGASALSVPVPAFGGKWAWSSKPNANQRLLEFSGSPFLTGQSGLDAEAFRRDLAAGLFFDSNIPTGYGLGSSGSLCAAIYDRYGPADRPDNQSLKQVFARMESFFHGSSSGIDPLTSYLNQSILIRRQTEVHPLDLPKRDHMPEVFLLDTGLPRTTGPLVQWFLDQHAKPVFREQVQNILIPAHETMVSAWIEAEPDRFMTALQAVSAFQLQHFIPMIPDVLRDLWQASLEQGDPLLKICGAGGGGFLLGFTLQHELPESLTGHHNIIYPFRTQP